MIFDLILDFNVAYDIFNSQPKKAGFHASQLTYDGDKLRINVSTTCWIHMVKISCRAVEHRSLSLLLASADAEGGSQSHSDFSQWQWVIFKILYENHLTLERPEDLDFFFYIKYVSLQNFNLKQFIFFIYHFSSLYIVNLVYNPISGVSENLFLLRSRPFWC